VRYLLFFFISYNNYVKKKQSIDDLAGQGQEILLKNKNEIIE
jgi:hypothetical protein